MIDWKNFHIQKSKLQKDLKKVSALSLKCKGTCLHCYLVLTDLVCGMGSCRRRCSMGFDWIICVEMTQKLFQSLGCFIEYNQNQKKIMQVCNTFSPQFNIYGNQLHKTASLPAFQDQAYYSSSSIDSLEEGYWRSATRWILRLRKKINIGKSTLYLAISYMWRLVKQGCHFTQDNYQKIAAALLLMSAKMNEIYPPKMSVLIQRCSKTVTKDELIAVEGWILSAFNFDMSFSEITYSHLAQFLGQHNEDKMEDSEKLLGLAVTQRDIMKAGEEMVAMGIVYLIQPTTVKEWGTEHLHKIKTIASKIYNLYILNKSGRS